MMRHRVSVASRTLAAILGGYALTSALTMLLLAALMPMPETMARVSALKPGFLIYLLILLWVFHARSATRAWAWLAAWTGVASALCWAVLKGGWS
ncbi:iron transporter [Pseudothauera nasutitermitis]|uniref:Iron transporter n=2 Tax=Pseudothauera nasutitermitis TaxID=2565930 RepID=A0A4S4B0G0_9RHOO|nr:iron transporter [Pseudothauera nasutitermitis]